MDLVLPVFVLAGGEIFLALVAARVAVWVWRGWRAARRASGEPRGPGGPGGGLRVLRGGGQPGSPAPLREAA